MPLNGRGLKQCIPETQFNGHIGNKDVAYLAMLATIGLDSPTKSMESRDNINQSGHNQPGGGGNQLIRNDILGWLVYCIRANINFCPKTKELKRLKGNHPSGKGKEH